MGSTSLACVTTGDSLIGTAALLSGLFCSLREASLPFGGGILSAVFAFAAFFLSRNFSCFFFVVADAAVADFDSDCDESSAGRALRIHLLILSHQFLRISFGMV